MKTQHVCSYVLIAGFLAGALACAGAPRQRPVKGGTVSTGPETLTAARNFLEGRWVLESFEVRPPGKAPIVLKGSGTLVYDNMGNLKMDIRADEASADVLRASGIDIRDGMISTDGLYRNRHAEPDVDLRREGAGSSHPWSPRDGSPAPLGR